MAINSCIKTVINHARLEFDHLFLFGKFSRLKLLHSSQAYNPTRNMSVAGNRTDYMKILERNPKRSTRIRFLGELFKVGGYDLKIAGGAVRDLVNNTEPVDIDFATDAHPDETLKLVQKHEDILRIIVTASGQKHGTVAIKFKETDVDLRKRIKLDNAPSERPLDQKQTQQAKPEYDEESPYEITTLRCDKITDGRHAEVEFINDWKKDAERRDLTINSMFLNLDDGQLVDYFGGEQDCKDSRIRFVGQPEERIKEDYLRILRFFRFWLRFSKNSPEPDQLEAIKNNLDGLNQISGERIKTELKKTFCHLPCSKVIQLMLDIRIFELFGFESNLLGDYQIYADKVMSEVRSVELNVEKYFHEYLKPQLMAEPQDYDLKRINDLIPIIIFSACFQAEEHLLAAHERLKFSNLEKDTIHFIIENRSKDPSLNAFKYQLVTTNGSSRQSAKQRMIAYLICIGKFDYIEQLRSWDIPHFPLNGKQVADAVKANNLHPSKTKDVIDMVKLAWAKRDYAGDQDELLELMKLKIQEIALASRSDQ